MYWCSKEPSHWDGYFEYQHRLIETVLLSTNNICHSLDEKKENFEYTLSSRGLGIWITFSYGVVRMYLIVSSPDLCLLFFDLKSLFRDFLQELFLLFFQVECVVVEKLDSMINGIKLCHMFLHDKEASTCLKIIVNKNTSIVSKPGSWRKRFWTDQVIA